MLPKKHRISGTSRVQYVYDKGRRFGCGTFQLRFLPNKSGVCRFSVMLPKKTGDGSAVTRNKIRRRVHEAIRKNFSAMFPTPPKTCYDVAVIVHKEAAKMEYAALEKEVLKFLHKILL